MQTGDKLNSRYLIERELGRGGIGVVYLARDERLHAMPVVIKFLLDASGQNEWVARKFLQEAEALTRINHPGVVRIIDRDQTSDGKPFFVMEFVPGRPLREVMAPEGMHFEHASQLLAQIGSALHAAHQQGVIHRDLKPENILLQKMGDGSEQIKLIDFGIAKVWNSQAAAMTDAVVVAGSLMYIAPEQLTGAQVSPATDVYTLAAIAYEMLTGRRPFNPDAPTHVAAMQQLLQMQQAQSIIPPKQLRPSLPISAQEIILQGLLADPQKRPHNARIFVEKLSAALAHPDPAFATGVSPRQPAPGDRVSTSQSEDRLTEAIIQPVTSGHVSNETRGNIADQQPPAAVAARKRSWALPAIGALILLACGIWAATKFLRPAQIENSTSQAATISLPERVFNYSVSVQKDPKLYPNSKPFQLPGEVVFSPGDRVKFTFSSPQSGHFYIINESPSASGAAASFNILFPSTTSNNGSSQLTSGRQIVMPERGEGFIFDEEQGTEKLWLIWSANPVAECEAVKRYANPTDAGEIKDAALIGPLQDFLTKNSTSPADSQKDETARHTIVKGKGDVLVKLLKLEHH